LDLHFDLTVECFAQPPHSQKDIAARRRAAVIGTTVRQEISALLSAPDVKFRIG
jgi:hypothetical protein